MKYKAIIFDLDNTAIPNELNGKPSQLLQQTISNAQSSIKLCAATGRNIAMVRDLLSALRLKDPCVISGGTQIINPVTAEVLWEVTLEPNDIKKVLKICTPYHYEVLVRNELLGEGGPAATRASLEGGTNIIYVMGCVPTDAEVILAELKKVDGVAATWVPSWTKERIDIHITHKDATKENAVSELVNMLELSKEEVIGVGDADNDIHLFEGVGLKVAMGNSTNTLKEIADEITDSVTNDGLAKTIRKYS